MVDKVPLRKAVSTAWSVYLATHLDVDATDGRRSLLERHLLKKWEARERDDEELTCLGLAYLKRLSKHEC
jgi:hypothetical protein